MRPAFANLSDLGGGALLLVVGALGVYLTQDLPMRSGARLGPGAMPLGVSLIVAAFGAALVLRAWLVREAPPTGWRLRPALAVSVAIVAFAFTIERGGLVLASLLLAALAVAARPRPRLIEAAIYIPALVAFTVLVFKILLKQPLALWPA